MAKAAFCSDTDDEVFAAAARAMSTRGRLDALLMEALVTPGMAIGVVEQISELFAGGLLHEAEQSLTVLKRSR